MLRPRAAAKFKMTPGFQTRIAETVTTDFRNFKLTKSIELYGPDGAYYKMPVGAPSDLASVPQEFWTLLPPFGEYALEAYAHDGCYQNWLQKWDGTQWVKAALTKPESDSLFDWLMSLNKNITEAQAQILYHAVVECGMHAFKEDRA